MQYTRSQDKGVILDAYDEFSQEQTLEMFEKMCKIRHFEENTGRVWGEGKYMKMPIYLSIGQESIPAAISTVFKEPYFSGQNRVHGYYLAYNGNESELRDELLHKNTGCNGGMCGSGSPSSSKIKMVGHDGFIGSSVPISNGFIYAINHNKEKKEKFLQTIGDASMEEDYVLAALGDAASRNLEILYICEDNNLSILTEKNVRRNWDSVEVAKGFGLKAVDIADDPWTIMHYVNKFQNDLPAFINIHTSRDVWHAGNGRDEVPNWPWWSRFELVKNRLKEKGLEEKATIIENNSKKYMYDLWEDGKK